MVYMKKHIYGGLCMCTWVGAGVCMDIDVDVGVVISRLMCMLYEHACYMNKNLILK